MPVEPSDLLATPTATPTAKMRGRWEKTALPEATSTSATGCIQGTCEDRPPPWESEPSMSAWPRRMRRPAAGSVAMGSMSERPSR